MSHEFRAIRTALGAALLAGVAAASLSGCSDHGKSSARNQVGIAGPAPFANSNGTIPPGYNGPLFQLSHAYPATEPAPLADPPWRAAIGGGVITPQNAGAYVMALKTYVAPAMRTMLLDYAHWNAATAGWYNEPWLAPEREPIHGMYLGTESFPISQFSGTGLTAPFSTYVLTYYDVRAAHTLFNVWGTNAMVPTVNQKSTQFAPGSVIVKAAFTTANGDKWPAMQNALQWPLYIATNATSDHARPQIDNVSFMQFDIIVKDPDSAPGTGWVFSTLVYDAGAPGADVWDKMVPLGAMWGNDPEVNSALPNHGPLRENWINPSAPKYATTTLGWGGRLSGPNDGALNDAILRNNPVLEGKQYPNLPSSSCMGCHISAQWPMQSFLLPTPTNPPQQPLGSNSDYLVMLVPGSPQWMRWFQSPRGDQPMDAGSTAFDYDMVFAFKSLPEWLAQATPAERDVRMNRKGQPLVLNQGYNGKPVPRPR